MVQDLDFEGRSFVRTVRLEVGTAHRCGVHETVQVKQNRFGTQQKEYTHVAPVGGAHL